MPSSPLAEKAVHLRPYFDDSAWPVIHVSGPVVVTPGTIDEYTAGIKRCLTRHEEFVVVSDARLTREMSARERRALADFEKQYFDELHLRMKGIAIVFSSRVVVGITTAVTWLSTPPYPKRCFVDLAEGEAWARSLLRPPRR